MTILNIPALNNDSGFSRYLQEIRAIPSLDPEEEYMLGKRLVEHKDISAAHKLVTSHLKLVAKIAYSFKGYNLPMMDLVAEGNIGLMHAVKKFNPDLGYRLSTYAIWWIKAAIQEFILKSWSLVKIGTTSMQKKLFFNLGKIKRKLQNLNANSSNSENITTIAKELNASEKEVTDMDMRINCSDISLNSFVNQSDSQQELIDIIPDKTIGHDVIFAQKQEMSRKKQMLKSAISLLNDREKDIIYERHLKDDPSTLEELSKLYSVSRERIRQIEAKALEKIKKSMLSAENVYALS